MIKGHGDDAYLYDHIRIDFSSNISQPSDHTALMAHLAARPQLLGHYPEPEAWSLEAAIARRHGISPSQVLVTSGATEAIYLIRQALPLPPDIVEPTFSEYRDADRLFSACEARGSAPGGDDRGGRALWLCNPNNPTGEVLDRRDIDALAGGYGLLVVDQSYEHYTPRPVLTPRQALRRGNTVLIHSFSKTYSVPGLRLGYITAPAAIIRRLRPLLRPWSVSALAIEAGHYLLQQGRPAQPRLEEAQQLRRQLLRLQGISVLPTQTNFMLCTIQPATARALKDYLARQHGLLIRDASNFHGLSRHHFRVAAQRTAENDQLVAAIGEYLSLCTK